MPQHLMQMRPMAAAYYPNNVTSDHIQQYLNENKSLILKIVESQYSGKLSECAENQARLQRNLMYLAAIADSLTTIACGARSGSEQYMSHQQAQMITPQSLIASRSSMLYAQQQFSVLQQQQALHGQVGMSCGGSMNLNILQSKASTVGCSGALGARGFLDFTCGSSGEGVNDGRAMVRGSKQDIGSGVESAEVGGGISGGQCDDGN